MNAAIDISPHSSSANFVETHMASGFSGSRSNQLTRVVPIESVEWGALMVVEAAEEMAVWVEKRDYRSQEHFLPCFN